MQIVDNDQKNILAEFEISQLYCKMWCHSQKGIGGSRGMGTMDVLTYQSNFFHFHAVCGINFVKISFYPKDVGGRRLGSERDTIGLVSLYFLNCIKISNGTKRTVNRTICY